MSHIGPNAQVSDHARVSDDARVSGDALVYGDARVFGNARVFDDYVGDGAYVCAPHHVQTYRDADGVLWTVYRRRDKKPRIMRADQPVKYRAAPAVVRALAAEVAA